MHFLYDDYLRECFSQPMLSLLWTLPFIVLFLLPTLLALWGIQRSPERRAAGKLVLALLCLLVVIGFPLHKQISVLIRTNGFAILQDRNAKPHSLTGMIETVELPKRSAETRYHHDGRHVYGAWLTIGGFEYYAVTNGELDAGDTVYLEYLPKSRCVLYLAPVESTNMEEYP